MGCAPNVSNYTNSKTFINYFGMLPQYLLLILHLLLVLLANICKAHADSKQSGNFQVVNSLKAMGLRWSLWFLVVLHLR
jgi:hypothetical protein